MVRVAAQPDVLVLGGHPAAYLAAALLRDKSSLMVVHAAIPQEDLPNRLVVINPELFDLHKMLAPLRKTLPVTQAYGLHILSDQIGVASEHAEKSPMTCIGAFDEVREAMRQLAQEHGAELVNPSRVQIGSLDEHGAAVSLDAALIHPKILILAGSLRDSDGQRLGLPEAWDAEIIQTYTFVTFAGEVGEAVGAGAQAARPTIPISLDLGGMLSWAWLLQHRGQVQLAVQQSRASVDQIAPHDLLRQWAAVLRKHKLLDARTEVPFASARSIDLPLAGALEHEGVANRTLLIGPAGGFFSACSEDIYPNCWSALFAADAARKALKERHVQDALQPYRHKWRTTLGDYLRGPQQNLRYLLPLVYRNQVMTTRLTEAILLGKSVVR